MTLRYGKKGEDAWTSDLAHVLEKLGVGATPFPIFHVYEAGRRTTSKPDLEIGDGGICVASAKLGEEKLLVALSTAQEYHVKIPRAEELGGRKLHEVFAITYPAIRGEPFHLYALARAGRPTVKGFVCDTLEELAQAIVTIIRGEEAKLPEEPITSAAPKLLYYGARELAKAIKGAHQEELEKVFGGHNFFQAVLATALKGKEKSETLRLGAAFLFVNQALFYVLLTKAAEEEGRSDEFPPIADSDMEDPQRLHDFYFERVHDKNYEPIYGIRVGQFFEGKSVAEACRNVIQAIIALAPKIDKRDLAGQVFQTLIPFSIRKPLGAHYTNPKAAELLASLSIDRPDMTVFDPACGSGTLLVASYHRKAKLAGETSQELHRRFLEEEITGTDAMAFASHLAAVNLALQQPLLETNHVRVGTTDSTLLSPGAVVQPTTEALPSGLRHVTLDHNFASPRVPKKKGPVQMGKDSGYRFAVNQMDVVIMNPPFTSWYNMQRDYREGLERRFAEHDRRYDQILTGKPSQQAFFLLFADRFLKERGKIAAVLPLTTFTGKTFQRLTEYLLDNYRVTHIVIGMGRASFSEDTSFTECLFVAEKASSSKDWEFNLIGTLKAPTEWTSDDIEEMVLGRGDSAVHKRCSQSLLRPGSETLWGLALRLNQAYDEARTALDRMLVAPSVPIASLGNLIQKHGLKMHRPMTAGEHSYKLGPKAIFACRSEERALKQVDRLVLEREDRNVVVLRDRVSGTLFEFQGTEVVPALRRFSLLRHIDVTGSTDFAIARPGPSLEKAMTGFYRKQEAAKFLRFLRKNGNLQRIVAQGSAKVNLVRRVDLAGPGTTLLSCWSAEPLLLASNGFAIHGFADERQEKFLCLWLNSTPALAYLLAKATVTRGSWVYLDKFSIDSIPVPDWGEFSREHWRAMEDLWNRVHRVELMSLMDQLRQHNSFRVELDDTLLELLGMNDSGQREEMARTLRRGVLGAIEMLRRTMNGPEGEPSEETEIPDG